MLKVAAGVKITADPGVVFKVKNDNGDYKAMLSGTALGTDLTGLVVEGVTFDQNTPNNPVTDNAILFAGFPRYAIYVTAGSGSPGAPLQFPQRRLGQYARGEWGEGR